ncbi:MAG: hypothetical protein AB7F31_02370 [Parachlamydiales bacterium]
MEIFNINTYSPEQRNQATWVCYGVSFLSGLGALYTTRHLLSRPLRPLFFGALSATSFFLAGRLSSVAPQQPLVPNKVAEKVSSFTLTGTVVVYSSETKGAVLDIGNPDSETTLKGGKERRHLITFTDGHTVGADRYETLTLWDQQGTVLGTLQQKGIEYSCLGGNANEVVAGGWQGEVIFWLTTGTSVSLKESAAPIRWIDYDPKGKRLCYLQNDEVKVWDPSQASSTTLLPSSLPCYLDKEKGRLIGVTSDKVVKSIDMTNLVATDLATLNAGPIALDCQDGRLFVATYASLYWWEFGSSRKGSFLPDIQGKDNLKERFLITNFAWSSKMASVLVTADKTGGIQTWDLGAGQLMRSIEPIGQNLWYCRLSLDQPKGQVTQAALDYTGTLLTRTMKL